MPSLSKVTSLLDHFLLLWRLCLLVMPDQGTDKRTNSIIELFWKAKNVDEKSKARIEEIFCQCCTGKQRRRCLVLVLGSPSRVYYNIGPRYFLNNVSQPSLPEFLWGLTFPLTVEKSPLCFSFAPLSNAKILLSLPLGCVRACMHYFPAITTIIIHTPPLLIIRRQKCSARARNAAKRNFFFCQDF